jgi:type VI secretion system protein VasD
MTRSSWLSDERPALALLALGLMVASCATPAPPGKCKIRVMVEASEDVNQDKDGRSLPTTVRLLQLRRIKSLKNAGFEELWNEPKRVLGEDLLESEELVIYPEELHVKTMTINDEATHFVGTGIFTAPEGKSWRTIFKLPEIGTTERCAADKAGGPLYLLLANSVIKGDITPLTVRQAKPPKVKDDGDEDPKKKKAKKAKKKVEEDDEAADDEVAADADADDDSAATGDEVTNVSKKNTGKGKGKRR